MDTVLIWFTLTFKRPLTLFHIKDWWETPNVWLLWSDFSLDPWVSKQQETEGYTWTSLLSVEPCFKWCVQGSVLGLSLFLIFINDLPEIVQTVIKLFAGDDATLLMKNDCRNDCGLWWNSCVMKWWTYPSESTWYTDLNLNWIILISCLAFLYDFLFTGIGFTMNVSTSIMGVEFAPLWIPLNRRLQTFAVYQWTLSFLFLGLACLSFMIYLTFTPWYPIPLLYAVWYVYDFRTPERGGRRWDWVRRWTIWKHYRDYFPVRLVKTAPLDVKKNYILAFHPHGIMGDGAFCNFGTDATGFSTLFPGVRPVLLTIAYQFLFPLHREYFMTTGKASKTVTIIILFADKVI